MLRGHISTSTARALALYAFEAAFGKVQFFTGIDDCVWRIPWMWAFLKLRTEMKERSSQVETRFLVGPANMPMVADSQSAPALDVNNMGLYKPDWMDRSGQSGADAFPTEIVTTPDLQTAFREYGNNQLWIFSRDANAVAACEWARNKGIRIPADLSIIGLEDDPASYPHGLSTCVPDWVTNGYLMAHSLIRDFPVAKTRKGHIATRAKFRARLTTRDGPPGKRRTA